MRFIVCVKQVPETNDLKFDPDANRVLKEGVSTIINPFDQFALEQAIKIKQDEDEIIAISIGDAETKSTLMRCLALGADRGILLDDTNFQDSDTFATSNILVTAINKIGESNIIFCGNSSFDTGSSQVGPELAALLNIPQITYAESVENVENGKVKVKPQTDEGYTIVD
jgi:electron transfer flavoprotein beta subunit